MKPFCLFIVFLGKITKNQMENKDKKLKEITVSMQEIWKHTRPMVQKSKKVYSRKGKKNKNYDQHSDEK